MTDYILLRHKLILSRFFQVIQKCVQLVCTLICTAEEIFQVPENLLTPVAHSLFISVPLQYFYKITVHSTIHLSKLLSSMKCIENWFVLSRESKDSKLKLVRVSDKSVLTLEITSDSYALACLLG